MESLSRVTIARHGTDWPRPYCFMRNHVPEES